MKTARLLALFASAFITALTATATAAAEDGAPLPRLNMSSEMFEVVGLLDGKTLTLFIDRFETNEPVLGAQVEVEAGSAKGLAQAMPDGTYVFSHELLAAPGSLPVSLGITAGADIDLLVAELLVAPAAVAAAGHGDRPAWQWVALALGGMGLLIVLLRAVFLAGRRRSAPQQASV